MVATVQILEKNSSAENITVKTGGTVQFRNADSATTGTANPMVIPNSGFDFSFEKWLRLRVTVAPDTQISNLRFHTDGSNTWGAGVLGLVKNGTTIYPVATGPQEINTTAGYLDLFAQTTSSPLAIDGATTAISTTGELGDHVVIKIQVSTAAGQGTLTAETATFLYDEI